MKHLLIVLMLIPAFTLVAGCTQPSEDVEETVVCDVCGEEECVCEVAPELCEDCGMEECECEVAGELCETCGKEECECPVEETPVEEGGE